jgi:Chemotaxis phosphatase CheX
MAANIPGPDKLAAVVSGVTQTMFGMKFDLAASRAVSPFKEEPKWSTVLLPILGPKAVTVAVAADYHGRRTLGGQMFSCSAEDVDESMANDSLSELANIVAGQVKSLMGLDQTLGLPIVVTDSDQRLDECSWRTATLENGSTRVVVWVAVTDSPITSH